MKGLFYLIFFLPLFAFAVHAQTADAVKWQKFSGFDEEFSVEIPENIKLTKFPENRRDSVRFYEGYAQETYFFISSGEDFPVNHYQTLVELANANNAQAVEMKVGNFPARRFSFTDDENFQQTILAVQASRRFYIFHTVSETTDDLAAKRFFSALNFADFTAMKEFPKIEKRRQKTPDDTRNLPPDTRSFPLYVPDKLNGGISPGIREKPPTGESRLKVLSKPAPAYTNLARFFEIKGEVILRVDFLADGTIGNVTPMKKLPFGLTKSAIAAARRITFEPEWTNNQPVSTTKNLSFKFTIY